MHLFVKTEKSKDMTSSNQNKKTASYKELILAFIFIFSGIFIAMGQDPTITISTNDTTICSDLNTFYIDFAQAAHDSTVLWTTTGSGTFTTPENDTTYYEPSNTDKTNGLVTLRLYAYPKYTSTDTVNSFLILRFTNPPVVDDIANPTSCDSYTLPSITGTNLSGNQAYYTATAGGGIKYLAGASITSTQTLYIYDSNAQCSDEENFTITIVNSPIVNDIADLTTCDTYTLPTITGTNLSGGEAYYTSTGGAGTKYNAGQSITSTSTLFIYDSNGSCSDEENFTITIVSSPVIANPGNQTSCDSYTLPAISGTGLSGGQAYYTLTGAAGTKYNAGASITSSQTLFIYDSIGTTCSDEVSFAVTITNTPAINNIANQAVCDSYTLPTITGSNLTGNQAYYTATGGLGVKRNAGDVITSTTTLYIYDINGSCSDEENFIITVTNTPTVNDITDPIVCDAYTLPAITGTNLSGNQAYYSASGGVGTKYIAGQTITTTQTLYIYDTNGSCSDEEQFTITVNSTPIINNPGNQSACDNYTLPTITGTNLSGNQAYYTATAGGGTKYIAGQTISSSMTLYIYDTNGSCSDQENFTITITASPNITDITNPTVCDTYTLPTITGTNLSGNEAYYTATGGGGTKYNAGESISSNILLYIYDSNGSCSDEENFTITIVASPAVNDIPNQSVCDSYTLPVITGSNLSGNEAYYTLSGGLGVKRNATDVITSTTTLYIYDINGSCSDEESFTITITNTPVVNDIANPTVCDSYTLPTISGTNLTGNQAYYTASGGAGTKYVAGQTITSSMTLYIFDSNGSCNSEEQFSITVNATPTLNNPGNQAVCDTYTLPTITGTNLSGGQAYYTAPAGGGTRYNAGVTLTSTATLYIYDSNGSCSDQEQFSVNITHSPNITNPGNQLACNSYTLPSIAGTNLSGNQAYYTASSGGGIKYIAGDVITSSIFLYIYDTNGSCDDEENFTITILPPPVITNPGDQTACGSYTLPPIGGTNLSGNQAYFTASGGNGTRYDAGDAITVSDILFIYDDNGSCSDEESFNVTIVTAPTISAGPNRNLCGITTATLAANGADYDNTTIAWTIIQGSGSLSATNILNPIYTPVAADYLNPVQLRISVFGNSTCSGTSVTSDVFLTYSENVIITGPATATICQGQTFTASPSTNTPSTYLWTTNGNGTFDNDAILNTTYTPDSIDIVNGFVALTVEATGSGTCSGNAFYDIVLEIKKTPLVNAGPALVNICESDTYTTSDATAQYHSSATWTVISGTGSISSPTSLTGAQYVPSAADIADGYAILRLTVSNGDPCYTTRYDDIRIEFTNEPEITVGTIPTLCQGAPYTVTIADTVNSSSVAWTLVSGTGVLINSTTINPTYTPSAADAVSGSIVLRLTASATSPCTASTTQNITFPVAGIPTVDVGSNVTVCETTSSITLSPTVTNGVSYLWTTSGSGTFSPSNTTLNSTYNPVAGDYAAGTIKLKLVVTGEALCSSTVSDSLNIIFTPAPTASVNATANVCQGVDYIISSASATNYSDITWTHDGDGTLNNIHLEKPTYTQAASDIGNDITLTMTVTGNGTCTPVVDQLVLTVLKNPSVNLNITETTVCGASYQISNVVAADYNSLTWTSSGNGSFDNTNALNPRYTFGSTDIAAGAATLTLTASPNSPCATNAVKSFIINISDGPVANAGPDASICETQNYITSTASSIDHSSVEWSVITGTGTFITSANSLTTTYQPSANDISLGSVTLRLTSYGIGSCPADYDDITLTITKQPLVDAGDDADGCIARVYTVSDASIANQNTYVWTTNGHGTLNNETTLTPSYTPHIDDINLNGGVVTLMLTASSNAPCSGNVTDTKVLTIYNEPTAFAGNNAFACAATDYAIQGATATYYTSLSWSSSSSGTLGFINNGTLTPTYHVNATDAANGYVDITLTATPKSPCATPATNTFRLTVLAGPTADAGSNTTICADGIYSNTDADTTNATSILWQTSGDGTFSSSTAIQPTYTPGTADKINGSVTLTLHAYGIGSNGCNHDVSDLTLTINKLPTADAGSLASICEGSNIITGASVANNSGLFWRIISGTGTLVNPTSLTPIYNTSNADTAAGTISLELIALPNAPCTDSAFSTITLAVVKAPTVDIAVTNAAVCGITSYSLLGGVTSNDLINNTFVWTTSGSGTFSDINSPTPDYLPSAADVIAGAVTLRVTASNSSCNDASDFMTLNIESLTVDAGPDTIVCAGSDYTFAPTIIGNHGTVTWSVLNSTGSGTFSNPNDVATTYLTDDTPVTGDAGKIVDFEIRVVQAGACAGTNDATSTISVEFKNIPVVDAGADTTICENEIFEFPLAHATDQYTTNTYWTTSGDGVFSGGGTHPTYVPGEIDIAQGYVDLTIHGESSPCQEVTDVMRLSFSYLPVVDAGNNATVDIGTSFTVSSATASNYASLSWTMEGGTGTLSGDTTLTPTYVVNDNDLGKSVRLILSATPTGSCTTPVTDYMIITIGQSPAVDFSASATCENTDVEFLIDRDVTDIGAIATYSWDFGDGNSVILTTPDANHLYATPGSYQVILEVTDTVSYTNIIWHNIEIKTNPIPNFSYDQPSCSGLITKFNDHSTAPSGYIVEWYWDFGDGSDPVIVAFGEDPNVEHNFPANETYPVRLTVTSSDSCSSTILVNVEVTAAPIAEFSFSNACFEEATQFTDISTNTGNIEIIKWNWDFGDPTTGANNSATNQNPLHIFSSSGSFDVTLITENLNGCIDDTTISVTVNPLPIIDFEINSGCLGTEVIFSPITTNTDLVYLWEFGDGNNSDLPNPSHLYESEGNYTVTLTVTDIITGCSNIISHNLSLDPLPIPVFEISEERCMSASIEFIDHSKTEVGEIVEWNWNFGDGNETTITFGNNPNVSHTYATSGSFDVVLTITNSNGCSKISKPQTIVIKHGPTALFEFDIACLGSASNFTDLSSPFDGSVITQWAWDFDDPLSGNLNSSFSKNPSHIFVEAKTHFVTLQVTDDNGCVSDTVFSVTINELSDIDFDVSGGNCLNQETSFEIIAPDLDLATVDATWDFGDPASGNNNQSNEKENPTHIYTNSGLYTVSLTINDENGCSNSVSKSISIKAAPSARFDTDAPSCDGTQVQFTYLQETNGSVITQWFWEFGDGTDSIVYKGENWNVMHLYPSANVYNAKLTVTTQDGCTNTFEKQVTVLDGPDANFYATTVCIDHFAKFTDLSQESEGGTIIDWYWNFGDLESGLSNTSSQQHPTHKYINSGTYPVRLVVVDAEGCTDTIIKDITVNNAIDLKPFTFNNIICENTTAEFFMNTAINLADVQTILWDFGDLGSGDRNTSDEVNPIHIYEEPGEYTITLTLDNNNCGGTIDTTIIVSPKPIANFEYSNACVGKPTEFTDISISELNPINNWSWNFGIQNLTNDTSTLQNPLYTYNAVGNYLVSLEVINDAGCTDILDSVEIEITPTPTAKFSFVETGQGEITFTNESTNATSYEWDFGDNWISDEINPVHQYDSVGTLESSKYEGLHLQLISLNEFECADTAIHLYDLYFKGLYIPTAFVPSSSNESLKFFKPIGVNLESFNIEVYSSWGQLVWQSSTLDENGRPTESWDGTYNGEDSPPGPYVWKANGVFKDGSIWKGNDLNNSGSGSTSGTVILIR